MLQDVKTSPYILRNDSNTTKKKQYETPNNISHKGELDLKLHQQKQKEKHRKVDAGGRNKKML